MSSAIAAILSAFIRQFSYCKSHGIIETDNLVSTAELRWARPLTLWLCCVCKIWNYQFILGKSCESGAIIKRCVAALPGGMKWNIDVNSQMHTEQQSSCFTCIFLSHQRSVCVCVCTILSIHPFDSQKRAKTFLMDVKSVKLKSNSVIGNYNWCAQLDRHGRQQQPKHNSIGFAAVGWCLFIVPISSI